MAVYATAQQLYACFRALFAQIEAQDPQATADVVRSQMSIRFNCSDPEAQIVIDGRRTPLQINYGASDANPTLDILLSADTLHEILLGDLRLSKAIGSGRMRPKGPVWKATALEPILHRAQALYPQVLAECNS